MSGGNTGTPGMSGFAKNKVGLVLDGANTGEAVVARVLADFFDLFGAKILE